MHSFRMPSLGADMDEGRLLEWRVKAGDRVERGQIVAVVDTAKAALEVECWQAGRVHQLLVAPGTTVAVGSVLATLLEEGEAPPPGDVPPAEPGRSVPAPTAPAPPPPPVSSPAPGRELRASPAARKRARETGVDLAGIRGSGPSGAILIEDVERASAAAAPQSAGRPPGREVELRAAIAAAMARSKREIPHYYLFTEIPLAAADAWLARENERRPLTGRLLMAALLLRATALAAREHPELNGWFVEGAWRPSSEIHVGVAIALRTGGVIAPVLREADGGTLEDLMRRLADLVTRARSGSLRSSELGSGSITVTSLGERGVDGVLGVIHPPQVALVGFGTPRLRPWVVLGELRPSLIVTASLAADHRVSDGQHGARFLARIGELLQHPEEL